jgi:hypothetical protein
MKVKPRGTRDTEIDNTVEVGAQGPGRQPWTKWKRKRGKCERKRKIKERQRVKHVKRRETKAIMVHEE